MTGNQITISLSCDYTVTQKWRTCIIKKILKVMFTLNPTCLERTVETFAAAGNNPSGLLGTGRDESLSLSSVTIAETTESEDKEASVPPPPVLPLLLLTSLTFPEVFPDEFHFASNSSKAWRQRGVGWAAFPWRLSEFDLSEQSPDPWFAESGRDLSAPIGRPSYPVNCLFK